MIGPGGDLRVTTGDEQSLGNAPASFVADQLELDGGIFDQNNGSGLVIDDANRGVTLGSGGGTFIGGAGLTLATPISGSGDLVAGGGDVILASSSNTYTGRTVADVGVLYLGADDAVPAASVLEVTNDGTGGQFDLNGFSTTVAGLSEGGGAGGGGTKQIRNTGAGASTLTIDVAAGDSYSYGRNLDDSGGGAISIVKNGDGTQVFNRGGGFDSFSGDLVINAGSLVVDGNDLINHSGATTVATGGTLSLGGTIGSPTVSVDGQLTGTPTFAGDVSVGTGTLAPGASAGTMTLSGTTLDLSPSAILAFELDGSDASVGLGVNDLIEGVGNLTLDGTLDVAALGSFAGVSGGESWTLITYAGTLTDNTLDLGTLPALGGGLEWEVNTSNSGVVTLDVVPESSTLLLGLLGTLGLVRRRR